MGKIVTLAAFKRKLIGLEHFEEIIWKMSENQGNSTILFEFYLSNMFKCDRIILTV